VVFFVNGALVTDADLINSYSDRVEWKVTGAIALGDYSNMVGNMNSGAAIALGAGATSIGVLTSTGGGVVTLGAGASAPGRLASDLSGVYLAPGTYSASSAVGLTGNLYLVVPSDYQTVAAEWKFEIGAAFSTAAGSTVYFVNSSGPGSTTVAASDLAFGSSVSWIVDGAITLGANSHVIGTLHSKFSTISLGADAFSGARSTGGGAIVLGLRTSCTEIAGSTTCI
jgi:hypothetical protein